MPVPPLVSNPLRAVAVVQGVARLVPDRLGLDGLKPVDKIIAQLAKVGIHPQRRGDGIGWSSFCPCHPGRSHKNFNFTEVAGGKVLVKCFAECETKDVMASLGLTMSDLYGATGGRSIDRSKFRPGTSNIYYTEEHEVASDEHVDRFWRLHFRAIATDDTPYDPARWAERAKYREELAEQEKELNRRRKELARRLGVSLASVEALDVGWREDMERDELGGWVGTGRWAWTFPEWDGAKRLVGLQRRYHDEALGKRRIAGSRCGLTLPADWKDMPGPIYVPVGASDVMALLTSGRCAVGRPSNRGGAADLAKLLKDDPRAIVVLGERDRQSNGMWPGDPMPFAKALAYHLQRPVTWKLPPDSFKDIRAYLNAKNSKEAVR
jgi:hypothetical protein